MTDKARVDSPGPARYSIARGPRESRTPEAAGAARICIGRSAAEACGDRSFDFEACMISWFTSMKSDLRRCERLLCLTSSHASAGKCEQYEQDCCRFRNGAACGGCSTRGLSEVRAPGSVGIDGESAG